MSFFGSVCISYPVCILYPVCSLHFILTGLRSGVPGYRLFTVLYFCVRSPQSHANSETGAIFVYVATATDDNPPRGRVSGRVGRASQPLACEPASWGAGGAARSAGLRRQTSECPTGSLFVGYTAPDSRIPDSPPPPPSVDCRPLSRLRSQYKQRWRPFRSTRAIVAILRKNRTVNGLARVRA